LLSKNKIKYINSLKIKKFRKKEKFFIVEGIKLINEILNSSFSVESLFSINFEKIDVKKIELSRLKKIQEKDLKKITSLKNHQKALAIVKIPEFNINENEIKNNLSLIIDNVQDAGNFGTIIRIADWFGIKNIICSENTVDLYNPKVIQATMGSITRVKIFYENLELFLKNFFSKDFNIYGTFLDGKNIYKKKLDKKGFIIIGNEGKGISKELYKFITKKISIPSFSDKKVESLNVSVATAIICSEFFRILKL